MARGQTITGVVKQFPDQKRDLFSAISSRSSLFAEALAKLALVEAALLKVVGE